MLHDLFNSLESFSGVQPTPLFVRDTQGEYHAASQTEVLQSAQAHLAVRVRGAMLDSPSVVRDFLRVRLGALQHEVFCVIHLDSQFSVLDYVEMFRGTLTQTSVYPREIIKDVLARSSAAVMLVHNHPSGSVEPSRADECITQTIKSALSLVDVRVVDHLIVAGSNVLSMAEKGLM
jgi:DNA repair protein RadC